MYVQVKGGREWNIGWQAWLLNSAWKSCSSKSAQATIQMNAFLARGDREKEVGNLYGRFKWADRSSAMNWTLFISTLWSPGRAVPWLRPGLADLSPFLWNLFASTRSDWNFRGFIFHIEVVLSLSHAREWSGKYPFVSTIPFKFQERTAFPF